MSGCWGLAAILEVESVETGDVILLGAGLGMIDPHAFALDGVSWCRASYRHAHHPTSQLLDPDTPEFGLWTVDSDVPTSGVDGPLGSCAHRSIPQVVVPGRYKTLR